ncbi:hypothetical protein HYW35_03375 [Candidatus Saccharibacteria bacterium]|nr:hypothetical protein [Candidatus Saccharibacteria bacterium]
MKRWGIVTFLVIILAAAATLAIWQPWQNKKNNQPPADSGQYLVIKEWGVKFKLPSDIANDVYYSYDKQRNVINFGSKQYAQVEPLCGADKIGLSKGLFRTSVNENPNEFFPTPFKVIDGYTYQFAPSSVGCNQNNRFNVDENRGFAIEVTELVEAISKTLELVGR